MKNYLHINEFGSNSLQTTICVIFFPNININIIILVFKYIWKTWKFIKDKYSLVNKINYFTVLAFSISRMSWVWLVVFTTYEHLLGYLISDLILLLCLSLFADIILNSISKHVSVIWNNRLCFSLSVTVPLINTWSCRHVLIGLIFYR